MLNYAIRIKILYIFLIIFIRSVIFLVLDPFTPSLNFHTFHYNQLLPYFFDSTVVFLRIIILFLFANLITSFFKKNITLYLIVIYNFLYIVIVFGYLLPYLIYFNFYDNLYFNIYDNIYWLIASNIYILKFHNIGKSYTNSNSKLVYYFKLTFITILIKTLVTSALVIAINTSENVFFYIFSNAIITFSIDYIILCLFVLLFVKIIQYINNFEYHILIIALWNILYLSFSYFFFRDANFMFNQENSDESFWFISTNNYFRFISYFIISNYLIIKLIKTSKELL